MKRKPLHNLALFEDCLCLCQQSPNQDTLIFIIYIIKPPRKGLLCSNDSFMLLDINFIPCMMSSVTSNRNYTVEMNVDIFAVFIYRIFQLLSLNKNPITLWFTSDNRFPMHDSSFFPSLRYFIKKKVSGGTLGCHISMWSIMFWGQETIV